MKPFSLLQHDGYHLWRLRDTPGQSTLTAFPFQPISRSAALGDAGSKAHHRPAVATPDKARAFPAQADGLPSSDAEHGLGVAELEPSAESGGVAEVSFGTDEGQQLGRHRIISEEISRRHSEFAKQLSSNGPDQGLEAEAQVPHMAPMHQEGERLGSLGASGRWPMAVQEEQDQSLAAEAWKTVLDSSNKYQLPRPEEGMIETDKVHSSPGRVADTGNEGWQSSLESAQALPQLPKARPAVAAQPKQSHEGNTTEQQTRIEHMLPGISFIVKYLHTLKGHYREGAI